MADTATLSSTLPNPTTPAERANQEVPWEVKWERDSYGEREKSLEVEDYLNIPPVIAEVPPNKYASEFSSEHQGIRSGEIIFNPVDTLENAVEHAASRAKKFAENAALFGESLLDLGKIAVGAGEYSSKYQPAETPQTEEEQEKRVEFQFTFEKNQDLAANQNIVRQQEEQKNVLRIVEDAVGMRKEDKNARLKLNANYQQAENKPYYAVQLRIALKAEEEKIEEVEEDQSLAETNSIVVDMNAMAEGGTGKGFANISATGGAGAG